MVIVALSTLLILILICLVFAVKKKKVCSKKTYTVYPQNTEFGFRSLVMLFLHTTGHLPAFLRDAFRPGPDARFSEIMKRWAIMVGFLPAFCLLQLINWLCFFIDELIFRGYHKVKMYRPVYVIGPPRSGTTHLHRVLGKDTNRFTTMTTWELFLAPSIVQKKLIRLIVFMDRQIHRPLSRLLSLIERRVLHITDTMHPSALRAPEEDYFLMCMTLTCSGLILFFPKNQRLWQYAFWDKAISTAEKQCILSFYKACLQKHLYAMGKNKILLSKNASFNPRIEHLNRLFPEASFIVCARDPVRTVPSMLSVANAARCSFGGTRIDKDFEQKMIALMEHHYHCLLDVLPNIPVCRWKVIPINHLHNHLHSTVLELYNHLGFSIGELFNKKLAKLDHESRHYKSNHHYKPDTFGLSKDTIRHRFQFAYALLEDLNPDTNSDRLTAIPQKAGSVMTKHSIIPHTREQNKNKKSVLPMHAPDGSSLSTIECKVLVLSDAIPDRNGVGTYYRDLMDYLEELVQSVEMIPAKFNCYFKQRNFSLRMPGDYTQRMYFPNIARISKRVREIKPDIILAPTLGPFGFLAWFLAKHYRIKLIVGHHTAYEKLTKLYWRGLRSYFSSRCLILSSRFLMRSADVVVATADEMAEEALRNGAKKVHCVGTTIAKSFFQKDTFPFSGDVKTVLYAGRLAAEKNVWTLLDAAKCCPDQTFLIAGEGPERKALQAKAKQVPNIKLLGWLSREQLLTQIDAVDMLVLPSHIESFGTVALEGMARGRLVLVSRHCGILEWPELAKGLYCINKNENLAEAVRRIENDDPAVRTKKALSAINLTRTINDQTLAHWLGILNGDGCLNG